MLPRSIGVGLGSARAAAGAAAGAGGAADPAGITTRFALVVDPMITPKAKHTAQIIGQAYPLLLLLLPLLMRGIFRAWCALDGNGDGSKIAAAAPDPQTGMVCFDARR